LHRHIFRQDAVFHETDHTVLGILVKFSWHIPDFPIYSNGTKPGTLHSIDIFLGLDVGKSEHHACALDRDGNKIFDKPLPQLESELAGVFHQLQKLGTVLVIVDQPNTIGALPIAVARDCSCEVGYLPGLAMRKAADLYPGRAKTDKRDAFIIADTARTMPHTLRAVDRNDEVLSALKMLSGFDDDIARDCTRTVNRLRSILTQIYPSLERVFTGSTLTRTPILELLIHYKGPQGLKRAGYQRVLNWMIKHTRKDPTPLVDDIFAALKAQTVTVPGSDAAELVIPQLAANIKALKEQRNTIAEQVEEMLADFPLCEVLDRVCPESASRPQRRSSLRSVMAPTSIVLAT